MYVLITCNIFSLTLFQIGTAVENGLVTDKTEKD